MRMNEPVHDLSDAAADAHIEKLESELARLREELNAIADQTEAQGKYVIRMSTHDFRALAAEQEQGEL